MFSDDHPEATTHITLSQLPPAVSQQMKRSLQQDNHQQPPLSPLHVQQQPPIALSSHQSPVPQSPSLLAFPLDRLHLGPGGKVVRQRSSSDTTHTSVAAAFDINLPSSAVGLNLDLTSSEASQSPPPPNPNLGPSTGIMTSASPSPQPRHSYKATRESVLARLSALMGGGESDSSSNSDGEDAVLDAPPLKSHAVAAAVPGRSSPFTYPSRLRTSVPLSYEDSPSQETVVNHRDSSTHDHHQTMSSPLTPSMHHQTSFEDHHHNYEDDAITRDPTHQDTLEELLVNNRVWAERLREQHPGLLEKLSIAQTPEILWIGCSDARVPAENVVGLGPGDLFVHRNIANVVVHTDLSMLSVLQYAVDVLKVRHVIVCGHYQCGGCLAAMSQKQYGLIDNWLRNVKDIYHSNRDLLEELADPVERADLLVELNVAKSVHNVCHTTIVQNAWDRGQSLSIHGWVYRLSDGCIRDLKLCIDNKDEVENIYTYVTRAGLIKKKQHHGSVRNASIYNGAGGGGGSIFNSNSGH